MTGRYVIIKITNRRKSIDLLGVGSEHTVTIYKYYLTWQLAMPLYLFSDWFISWQCNRAIELLSYSVEYVRCRWICFFQNNICEQICLAKMLEWTKTKVYANLAYLCFFFYYRKMWEFFVKTTQFWLIWAIYYY